LDSTHDGSREETGQNTGPEGETEQEGREDDLNSDGGTRQPGAIISRREDLVEILMQAL
jgi:hypothetical protein